jgi:hypothetical protein
MKSCPARDCSGGTTGRQSDFPQGMFEKIPEAHQAAMKRPKRCSYCGCVYEAGSKEIFGYYNNEILGQGWKPSRIRNES